MSYTTEEIRVLEEFGQLVRKARKACGWSQEELGEYAGLDRSHVGAIERGEQSAGLLSINKLAVALDESFEGFLPQREPEAAAASPNR